MCAEQGACVRRRPWTGYTINMLEFEFPTGTGLADIHAELKEFTVDAGSAPQRIRHAHLTNELANLITCPGSAAARALISSATRLATQRDAI
jgi:hypothetical protein